MVLPNYGVYAWTRLPSSHRNTQAAAVVMWKSDVFQYFPLFAYLRTTGETELLHELFVSPEAWLRILREGGTRSFEGWGKDTKWNTSLFHITTAAACVFLCEEGTRVQAYIP